MYPAPMTAVFFGSWSSSKNPSESMPCSTYIKGSDKTVKDSEEQWKVKERQCRTAPGTSAGSTGWPPTATSTWKHPRFAMSKLKPTQSDKIAALIANCGLSHVLGRVRYPADRHGLRSRERRLTAQQRHT